MAGVTLQLSFRADEEDESDLVEQIKADVQDVLDKYGVGDLARIRAFSN